MPLPSTAAGLEKTRWLNSTAVGEKSGGLRSTTAAASGRNPFVNRSIVEDIHLENYLENKNQKFRRGICSKYTLRTPTKNIDIWRFGVELFAILLLNIHIILYYIILYCIILYCIISYYFILHYNTMLYICLTIVLYDNFTWTDIHLEHMLEI